MAGGRDCAASADRTAVRLRRSTVMRFAGSGLRYGGMAIVGAIAIPHRPSGIARGRRRAGLASPPPRGVLVSCLLRIGDAGERRRIRRVPDRLLGYPDRRPGAGDRVAGAGRCNGGRSARRSRDRGRGRHPIAPVRRARAGRLHRARRRQRPGRSRPRPRAPAARDDPRREHARHGRLRDREAHPRGQHDLHRHAQRTHRGDRRTAGSRGGRRRLRRQAVPAPRAARAHRRDAAAAAAPLAGRPSPPPARPLPRHGRPTAGWSTRACG